MFSVPPLPRNIAAAVRDATHAKQDVRLSALRDLSRLGSGPERASVISTLASVLKQDTSALVRAQAALALADAEARESVGVLVAALDDAHARVRQMALVALGEVGSAADETVRHAVEGALSDSSAEIRFQALVALHHLRIETLETAVMGALSDDDAYIRYVAVRIAEERWLGSPDGRTAFAPSPALEGPTALPAALEAEIRDVLELDEAASVRLGAAILLGRAGLDADRQPILLAVSRRVGVRELEDEQAAVELCGDLGLTAAQPALERRAFGFSLRRETFAWQAKVALAKMGHRRAIDAILRGLRAFTRDGRTLAVAAAGAARLNEAREAIAQMRGDDTRADPNAVSDALLRLSQSELRGAG